MKSINPKIMWRLIGKCDRSRAPNVATLTRLLDASTDLRSLTEAAKVLGDWAMPEHAALHKRLLGHDLWMVRAEFLARARGSVGSLVKEEVLTSIHDENALVRLHSLQYVLDHPKEFGKEELREIVTNAFEDGDERVRDAAITYAGRFELSTMLHALTTAALRDPSFRVRSKTVEVLARHLGNQTVRSEIIACFEECLSVATHHRLIGTLALHLWGDKREASFDAVRSLIESTLPVARRAAAWVLGEVGSDDEVMQTLVTWLADEEDDTIQGALIEALTKHVRKGVPLESIIEFRSTGIPIVTDARRRLKLA